MDILVLEDLQYTEFHVSMLTLSINVILFYKLSNEILNILLLDYKVWILEDFFSQILPLVTLFEWWTKSKVDGDLLIINQTKYNSIAGRLIMIIVVS